jgi:hypothetical protein
MDLVGDQYVPRKTNRTVRQHIDRDALIALSSIRSEHPKLTISEVRKKAIEDGIFEKDSAPDISTIWRRLQKLGHRYTKPIYQDDRAKRSIRQWEACNFRKAQDEGLDPTSLLSFDESFIYYEQQTRGWGTLYKPAKLPKDKSVPRRALLCTVGFKRVKGVNKGFLYWVLIPPRPTFAPLESTIQEHEIDSGEKKEQRSTLKEGFILSLSKAGLCEELKKLGVKSPVDKVESMRQTLSRIAQRGRVGELRANTGKGRPSKGGRCEPFYGTARGVSEYLHPCMVPALNGEGWWNGDGHECKLKSEEGLRGCPDYVMREGNFQAKDYALLWDNASTHSPLCYRGARVKGTGDHFTASVLS